MHKWDDRVLVVVDPLPYSNNPTPTCLTHRQTDRRHVSTIQLNYSKDSVQT